MAKKATTKKPTRGIVLIAAGHPYYGHYAHNLAMSLKTTAPDLPICLLHAGDGLQMITEPMGKVFDRVINVDPKHHQLHGLPVWLRIKLCIDKLSPYDETIYLDADTICTPEKNIEALFGMFDQFKCDFSVQNRNFTTLKKDVQGVNRWCNLSDVQAEYGNGDYYDLYTEFMYFKKCKEVTKLFKDALNIFDRPKIKYNNFAGGMPDEMAFAIAMLINKMKPHQGNFLPIFWQAAENRHLSPTELHASYFLFSVGGNHQTNQTRKQYDNYVVYYSNKFGVRFPWRMKEKRDFLPERIRI